MNGSQSTAQNGQTPFRPGAQVVDSQPFTAIRDGTFLHNRTEEKTFQLLIDCLRLAQEDFYKFSSVNLEGSIFAGSSSSEPAFRTFIASAKSCPNLLPPWWTDAKLEECIQYPRREQEDKRNKNFDLRYAQEKSDIQETYGDNSMPMKLRMLAEKIYGHPPSGQPGASMLNIQASMETGSRQGWASTTIDMQHVV
ncbi:hypothetical protein B0A48_07428 [Cryoendolithus antarcticus]|uniref:Uncharacterized protein n=1 Tax=Cryoendolithus antarcticus TaxID=1507870 RepID=A0A1V8T8Z7_9PEZI|nr:hypothetical protein B0A48_07428 [Cryoendolithus antarcticus]